MKAALERRLSELATFADPKVEYEQYSTPADLAAHLVHLADVQGDLSGETVVDLGTGTGLLALGAATRNPKRVLGVERDPDALALARENERRFASETAVEWLVADATRPPLCLRGATVLMNPPFGAQRGNVHADRRFLETAAEISAVSYSIHNEDSREFVESFAADNGGEVTHAFRAELALARQYDHQTSEREVIDAEVFRVRW